ncbi:MAG: hypothetical protein KIT20_11860 [Alphaproteobacteria bacterium]|nr:hypothetical protein [Alphaproteobacteria bacterium]
MTLRRLHFLAAIWTMAWITGLVVATLGVELTGDPAAIALVKRGVLFAIVLLAPVMMTLGWAGRRLAGASRAPGVLRKKRRVLILSGNGVLVLIPCALALDRLASAGEIGWLFYLLKAVLVAAACTNLTLLGLNFRDGLALARGAPAPEAGLAARP